MSKHESDIDQGISVLKIRGHLVIAQLLQCIFHWSLQIFKQLQQQFTIYKVFKTNIYILKLYCIRALSPNPFTSFVYRIKTNQSQKINNKQELL